MDVADDGAADEDALEREEVRVLVGVEEGNVEELEVEELVDAVQDATHLQVVLQLHDHDLRFQRLEKR